MKTTLNYTSFTFIVYLLRCEVPSEKNNGDGNALWVKCNIILRDNCNTVTFAPEPKFICTFCFYRRTRQVFIVFYESILLILSVLNSFVSFLQEMPRNRLRTTSRGPTQDVMERAADLVLKGNMSIRKAAKTYDLCHVTLQRFINKRKANEQPQMGYRPHNRVFSVDLEVELAEYLKTSANIFYGLSPKEVRSLAYKYAVANKLKFPEKWHEFEMAGADWFTDFLKRNSTLSIRTPESTSIARACNFNKQTVGRFFDQLRDVMQKYGCEPQNIYNLDETGITTAAKPDKIIASKGVKQVGGINSHERGTLVTLCVAVNAVGNIIPPMFIFPRKNYHDHFLADAPVGSIGAANGSGWMQCAEFLVFLKHFVKHAKPTTENKTLLLLDNHNSHIQIDVIDFCRDNGIILLSFPPHTSHKLQPLDRSVYGPFKKYFNTFSDDWRKTHAGERMNIYHLPGLVQKALPLAATSSNIQAGFRCSGIYPFNRFIFADHEFAPAEVTDRPLQEPDDLPQNGTGPPLGDLTPPSGVSPVLHASPRPVNSTSLTRMMADNETNEDLHVPGPSKPRSSSIISPKELRPFPKAKFDKPKRKGRATLKSAIWTDTPEKKQLEERKQKKVPANVPKRNLTKHVNTKKPKLGPIPDSDTEDDEYFCLVCMETWTDSVHGEQWVQCVSCKLWSHEKCTKGDPLYYCHNCESE